MAAFCRKNPNSTHFVYPDTCNCCDYCLKNLGEKDDCTVGRPGAVSPLEMCGPGLECKTKDYKSTCQRISSSDCGNAQDSYDQRKKDGNLGMTEVRPECDIDGLYKPVHCIPGSLCYCLSPEGDRIFGELPYLNYEDEKRMTCGCSVNAWRAYNTLDKKHEISVARCTEIGTYDRLQCMTGESDNATCLCVDPETGSPITDIDVVIEENIDENSPPCFDSSRHSPGSYKTSCEIEREIYLSYKNEENSGDENELAMNEPFCQHDGKFARIQIAGSKMVCTDTDGRQIDRYEAEIGTAEEKTMDCNCARTRLLLDEAGVVELPTCCPNGNFERWQSRRNQCFCIDNDGNQKGLEFSSKDKSKLECYKTNQGNPCLPTTLIKHTL